MLQLSSRVSAKGAHGVGGVKILIGLAQINVTVGDIQGNEQRIAHFLGEARDCKMDCVVFPELAVTGYPPEDLLFKPTFIQQSRAAMRRLMAQTHGLTALIGYVDRDSAGNLYNAAAYAVDGKQRAVYHKMKLPNYGVFDEKRYFAAGVKPLVLRDHRTKAKLGVSICEDMWVEDGPHREEAKAGARILINMSASPYYAGKRYEREDLLKRRARQYGCWICYVNLVGGQDELVFDGGSFVVDPAGKVVFRMRQFWEGLFLVEIPVRRNPTARGRTPKFFPVSRSAAPLSLDAEIFEALILGLRDYVRKNGFSHVVIGLSGGIDSALTAAIAVAALGRTSVTGVSMPSRYSSPATRRDARMCAESLGIDFLEIPIERVFNAFLKTLQPFFRNRPTDSTEENLQARIRGTLLMALSNKFHWLVLATGNKSELSTGYCTLYGDMVGGFAVIKDVPKTWVYKISRYANRSLGRPVISSSVMRRAPTAELKFDQKDRDMLPPYPLLDDIMKAYVEDNLSAAQTQKKVKTSLKEIRRVLRMIDLAEYKRRQAPIGIKITPRAFGKDRRMPITNRYQDKR